MHSGHQALGQTEAAERQPEGRVLFSIYFWNNLTLNPRGWVSETGMQTTH